MMKIKVIVEYEYNYGSDMPDTGKIEIIDNNVDEHISSYINIFRRALAGMGFAEKSISEYLGDE